jgi:uncharacterized membrane protein
MGAGFAMLFAGLLVVNLFTDEESWLYAVLFGGAAVTVYVMPIVGALVALTGMVRKRTAP